MSSSAHRTTQPSVKPTRRRWASINDTAEHLDVTERTVRQMIADGRLTGYRLSPKFIRLDLDEVDAAMVPFGGGVVGMSADPKNIPPATGPTTPIIGSPGAKPLQPSRPKYPPAKEVTTPKRPPPRGTKLPKPLAADDA